MKTLVLGIGNSLLSDEGVGIHAVHRLSAEHGDVEDIEFLDGGTLSFTLAGAIEEVDHLIVIDAARLDAPPGTVAVFEDGAMNAFLGRQRKGSVHEVSLVDLLTIARLAERLPVRCALVGVEPQELDWGLGLSAAVAHALPEACDRAWQLVEAWRT